MSFAKDLFDGVQMKMVQSIDEYERLEVSTSLCLTCVWMYKCTCVHVVCMCVYDMCIRVYVLCIHACVHVCFWSCLCGVLPCSPLCDACSFHICRLPRTRSLNMSKQLQCRARLHRMNYASWRCVQPQWLSTQCSLSCHLLTVSWQSRCQLKTFLLGVSVWRTSPESVCLTQAGAGVCILMQACGKQWIFGAA